MKNLPVLFVAALSLLPLGCKKKGGESGADCAKAVSHSMELSKAEMAKMGTDDKMMQKLVDLGVQRCKEDKWSADATKCMVDAKTMADAQGCYGKLTAEQQEKMNKAAMELATAPGAGGAGDAGSAGSAVGSAAEGSAVGSAAEGSAAGSAGSAAGGSAEGGSAAGSGAGSAAGATPAP